MAKGPSEKHNVGSSLQWQRAISQLGRAMASKLSLDAVFHEFASGIKGYILYDRLLIHRVDPQNRIARIFLLSPIPDDTLDNSQDLYRKGETATEWVVRERKPFVRKDTAVERGFETDERLGRMGFSSYISIPLIYWDRVVGSLHIACKQPKAYGERELKFLMSVSEWLAIAMENARLFHLTHRFLEEQGVIHDLTSQINILDLNSLLQRLADDVATIFKADYVYVRLKDREEKLPVRAITGGDQALLTALQMDLGRERWILQKRQPLVISDLKNQDPSLPRAEALERTGMRSFLGVPILSKEEAIGIIGVLCRGAKDFSDRDVFFLQQLAAEAAVAIHHALLFDELKRLNQDLEQAAQYKSQFLALVSHELRTPLTIVIGFLDLMAAGNFGPVSLEQKAALEKIQNHALALLKMINDVLNLSRIEAGVIPLEVSTFLVEKVLQSLRTLTEDFERKSGLRIVWEVDPDLPQLTTDAAKLEEVLQNLIVNAFKYAPQGEVRIRVRNRRESQSVEFVVEDTGKGIAPENLPKIFEGFHQVNSTVSSEGVGLGLTIVKKYLDLLKGDIQVRSELGKGSTFTVTLPYTLST